MKLRSWALAGTAILALPLTMRADDKAKKESIGPVVYQLPGDWVKQRPMAAGNLGPIAQYGIPPVEGDDKSAKIQLRIYHFDNGGGGLQANVDRWIGMFEAEGREKKVDSFEADGMKITFVDIAGSYKEKPFPMAEDFTVRKNYRMLAAVVDTPSDGPFYFRAVGPAKTMAKNLDGFKNMLKTAKKAG